MKAKKETKNKEQTDVSSSRDAAADLAEEYREALAACGLSLKISKKYFEKKPAEPSGISRGLLDIAELRLAEKKEAKTHKFVRDRYHAVVLRFSPSEEGLLPAELCREYAFLLKKKDRVFIGVTPKETLYDTEKVKRSLEKRLQKMIRLSQRKGAQRACRDTWRDALRYMACRAYRYKKRILGKDRYFWDTLFFVPVVLLAVLVLVLAVFIGQLRA